MIDAVVGGLAWCAWCKDWRQVKAELMSRGRLFDVWLYTCVECGNRVVPTHGGG